jgi:hypothetical protein
MSEAEFEAKMELAGGRGTVLIKASNQDRRGSFGHIIVVNEDVAWERTLRHQQYVRKMAGQLWRGGRSSSKFPDCPKFFRGFKYFQVSTFSVASLTK